MLPRWPIVVFITSNLFLYSGSTSSESSQVSGDDDGNKSQDFLGKNVCVDACEDSTVEMQPLLESNFLQKYDKVDNVREPSSQNSSVGQRFKQFDMVTDCSDHFFLDRAGNEIASPQVS